MLRRIPMYLLLAALVTPPSVVSYDLAIWPQPCPLVRSATTPVTVFVVPSASVTLPPINAACICAAVGLVMPRFASER